MVGHTKAYAKVLINKDTSLYGKQVIVKVTKIHKWHVYGEVIDSNPTPIVVNYYDHFKGMIEEEPKEREIKEKINVHDIFKDFKIVPKENTTFKKFFGTFTYLFYIIGLTFMYLGLSKAKIV